MSIFRRDEVPPASVPGQASRPAPPPPARNPGPNPGAASRIAAGTRIEGAVLGGTDVTVEGEIEGRIEVGGRVVVADGGRVDGRVRAREIEVAGRVDGDLEASERVEIVASGIAEGDISAPRVVIAEGAFFKGNVEMSGAGSPKGGSGPGGYGQASGRGTP